MARHRSGHVRVAVAVAAHPGGKFHRHEVHRQLHAERLFNLFVQLAQKGGHAFPQAILHHGEAPFRLVDRRRAIFADLVGVPRLRHQLTQATHNLVALVVGDIAVIELLQAAIHLDQLMDQRAAGDLGRVRR